MKKVGSARLKFKWLNAIKARKRAIYSSRPDLWGFKVDFSWGCPNYFLGLYFHIITPFFRVGLYT